VAEGLVDAIHSVDDPRYAPLLSAGPAAVKPVDADVVVIWSTHARRSLPGVSRIVAASPYPPPGVHAADWLIGSLADLGVNAARPSAARSATGLLGLTAGELEEGRILLDGAGLDRAVLIHPGAGAVWKRWPADRFAEVARRLHDAGREVALVAGPADDAAVAGVLEKIDLSVLRDLPLRRLGAVLAQSCLYLGNDSGVSHLAAAAGARTVVLFGSTDPRFWAPLGDVRVVRRCGCTAREAGEVRVCWDPGCMEAISVEEVMTCLIAA
jgi:ADP-heptose:LPS heptosyltransferase